MRLLLVEDDVMVASGIKLGLADAGYAVDWVGSAERAEEVLQTETFDVYNYSKRTIASFGSNRMTTLAVQNDIIWYTSAEGKLYSFNGSGAPASAQSRWPMFRRDAVRSGQVPAPADGGLLVNLATRAQAGNGVPLIAGFVTKGEGTKHYLVRAIGPTLSIVHDSGIAPWRLTAP